MNPLLFWVATPFPNNWKNWSPWDSGSSSDGDRIFSIASWHTPIIRWWLKFFDHLRGHARYDFYFQKWYMHPPPFWWLKNFNHNLTYPHHQMVTERGGLVLWFWEKKNHPPISFLGDWRISIAIWWCACEE